MKPALLIFASAFAAVVWFAQDLAIPECDATDELATIFAAQDALSRIMEIK